MHHIAHATPQLTLASLGLRWLVLMVITLGMVISSVGMTTSHGVAVVAASHASMSTPLEDGHGHGHVHTDEGLDVLMAEAGSGGEHPHHGADHSHDTAHPLHLAWLAVSAYSPRWGVMVRGLIEMGQPYRLDRPPMG